MAGYKGRVLFVGHAYYNTWYLSRGLRKLGWLADTLNTDINPDNQIFYHGEDYRYRAGRFEDQYRFFLKAATQYDIVHFSNAHTLTFFNMGLSIFRNRDDIRLLRRLGKKIVYSNNGCLDGVSQSAFRTWLPEAVCDICPWRDNPGVCSDERNLTWGKTRNELADYQILLGGNRKDYNTDPRVHEVPGFYCLDPDFWSPDLLIPANYRLPFSENIIKIYHAVGNFGTRSETRTNRNLKSTHIYVPVIERLQAEGYPVELIFFRDVPNKVLRFYQMQADIFVDMLSFGFFGATAREGMMLGKPVVCFIRPEWRATMRQEIPDYEAELPIISTTPQTIYETLKDLIEHPEKRRELGRQSREFAIKWHSSASGAKQLDHIYTCLLRGEDPARIYAVDGLKTSQDNTEE